MHSGFETGVRGTGLLEVSSPGAWEVAGGKKKAEAMADAWVKGQKKKFGIKD